jgi:hypothetical protein
MATATVDSCAVTGRRCRQEWTPLPRWSGPTAGTVGSAARRAEEPA